MPSVPRASLLLAGFTIGMDLNGFMGPGSAHPLTVASKNPLKELKLWRLKVNTKGVKAVAGKRDN